MKIKVYGSGCTNCEKLHILAQQAVEELDISASVEYITDIQQLLNLGVMSSPVLTIDDKVLISGRIPQLEEIKDLIENFK